MKRLVVVGMLLFSTAAISQEQILFSGKVESGGYGGVVGQVCQINDCAALMIGGQGGWIIDHSFILGGGGYGLTTNVKADVQRSDGRDLYLNMGYGGLLLEYVFESDRLLHFSLHTLIGGGTVNYTIHRMGDQYNQWNDYSEPTDQDAFFVTEPGVTLTLNVTRFFRLGFGGTYRYVSGISTVGLTNDDLSGFGANLYFNFGKF
jgi:hypothetical protein